MFTKVTLVPTLVTSTEGFTPLAVMVTTLEGLGVGWDAEPGGGTVAVEDGADGVSVDPQLTVEKASRIPTTKEIAFARSNRRITFAS